MPRIYVFYLMMFAVLALGCQNASTSALNSSADNKAASPSPANSAAAADAHSDEHADDAPRITLADAKAAFDSGDAYFIDTRAAEQYKAEHIKGAVNISAGEIDAKIGSLPKNKKIIAYCS